MADQLGNIGVFESALKSGGKFFVDVELDGNFEYIFESHEVTLTPTVETTEIADTEDCITGVGKVATKLMKLEGAFSTYTYSPEVISFVFAGTLDDTGDTEATDEAVILTGVKKGSYQYVGYVGVSTVVVQDDTDTTTYVEGVDYTIDLSTGLLGIIISGGISDDDDLHLVVNSTVNTLSKVQLMNNESKEIGLMFIGCPTEGDKIQIEFWKVKMIASGDIPLKGDDFTPIDVKFVCVSDSSKGTGISKYAQYRVLPNP